VSLKVAVGIRRFLALALAASTLLCPTQRSTAADSESGAQLAALCAACHRLDNQSLPTIVGRDATKLAAEMEAFKSGKRASQIMHEVAISLSADEIATVSRYLAQGGVGR